MRLPPDQVQTIKDTVARIVGPDSQVWLFGSRVRDDLRGGDIDLFVETDEVVPNRIKTLCKIECALVMALGDRKMDILLKNARTPDAGIPGCTSPGGSAMSLAYLAEHAENALFALELAERETTHLAYTHKTLFAQQIDLSWVKALATREDLAEKIDAFVGRFGRLQDHIGDKLIPRFARLIQVQRPGRVGRWFTMCNPQVMRGEPKCVPH